MCPYPSPPELYILPLLNLQVAKGGEDAWFISDDGASFGVADGVGGWSDHGVDPALYARELMERTREALATEARCAGAPRRALKKAHLRTRAAGSCTAVLAMLCNADEEEAGPSGRMSPDTGTVGKVPKPPARAGEARLFTANLGDSGVALVRAGAPDSDGSPGSPDRYGFADLTPAQQHGFNFPFQLGSEPGGDKPEMADERTMTVRHGDTLVMASDGLWDNLFPNEISSLVAEARKRDKGPRALARVMAAQAQRRGQDGTAWSPFMHGALQKGFAYQGGKLDDVTVIVGYVVDVDRDRAERGAAKRAKM